jgi:hypothetical protein
MRPALAIPVLAACVPGAPDAPSFQEDVMPILAASCIRCHGSPALGGAPTGMRLDAYGDIDGVAGAATSAGLIAARIDDRTRPMPPRFALADVHRDTLRRWALDPQRGAPRPDNRPPTATLDGATPTAAGLAIHVRVSDPDGDVVAGSIRSGRSGASIVGAVRSGAFDLALVAAPGRYPLVAELDDGAELHAIDLGIVEVP